MSWYITNIESGRSSNLNMSQFSTLRFISYLLYNSYIPNRVFAISNHISADNPFDEDDSAILTRAQKLWRQTPIRKYVSKINRCILNKDDQLPLPLIFVVRQSDRNENVNVSLEVSPASRRPWPKNLELITLTVSPGDRKGFPINGHTALDKIGFHTLVFLYKKFKKDIPVGKKTQTSYVVPGCDSLLLHARPGTDCRRKRFFPRLHSVQRLSS